MFRVPDPAQAASSDRRNLTTNYDHCDLEAHTPTRLRALQLSGHSHLLDFTCILLCGLCNANSDGAVRAFGLPFASTPQPDA